MAEELVPSLEPIKRKHASVDKKEQVLNVLAGVRAEVERSSVSRVRSPFEKTARLTKVPAVTIRRWAQEQEAYGQVQGPKPRSGRPPKLDPESRGILAEIIRREREDNRSWSVQKVRAELPASFPEVSDSTLSRAIKSLQTVEILI